MEALRDYGAVCGIPLRAADNDWLMLALDTSEAWAKVGIRFSSRAAS